MAKKVIRPVAKWCWLLLVLTLPITSQPLIARFARTGSVAPVAGIFLAILFVVWFLPFIWQKGELPKQTIPLLLFVLWAILVTLFAFFRENPAYKDISVFASAVKGVSTLFIGLIFFLVTSTYIQTAGLLKITLKLVNWGGFFIVLWSFMQVAVNRMTGDYPHWMDAIQSQFSMGVLVQGRATGFALEPSWLAHQLNMLYLPYWLAAAAIRYSAHPFRFWKIHIEDILLVLGAATLMASFSRVGLLAFLLMVAFVFILINLKLIKWIESRVFRSPGSPSRLKKILVRLLLIAGLILIYAALLFLVVQAFLRFDPRMGTLFQFSPDTSDPVLRYANSLKFGERLVYWLAAWKIFGNFPWAGVGLGLAGYYFPTSIVAYGWSLVEVKKLLFHTSNLLNIKSIWFRLLAETGIIGFSLFFTWLFVILISAIRLFVQETKLLKVVGLTGILVMIGFLIEGFSIDSFAMPYLFFSTGIIAAASMIFARSSKNPDPE